MKKVFVYCHNFFPFYLKNIKGNEKVLMVYIKVLLMLIYICNKYKLSVATF